MSGKSDVSNAILDELRREAAVGPEAAVDASGVRRAIGAREHEFDASVSELTAFGMVGMIIGDLYLKHRLVGEE